MKFFIKPKNWIHLLHDVAMVLREENVYSYNNAKCLDKVVFVIVCIVNKRNQYFL